MAEVRGQYDLFGDWPTPPKQEQASSAVLEEAAPPPVAPGMVRLKCGTCGGRGGWKLAKSGNWTACQDCDQRGWRDVPERQPLDPAIAEVAAGVGYNAKESMAKIHFARAVKPLGWDRLVTEPNPPPWWIEKGVSYPNLAHPKGKWPTMEERPARVLSDEKAARLANLILRGVASDKPHVTTERWQQALACLPEFHREYLDPFGDPWQPPLATHGEVAFDVREALKKAFPGDLMDEAEEEDTAA